MQAVENDFSSVAWGKILELYSKDNEVSNTLTAIVRLSVFNSRWYSEIIVSVISNKAFLHLLALTVALSSTLQRYAQLCSVWSKFTAFQS